MFTPFPRAGNRRHLQEFDHWYHEGRHSAHGAAFDIGVTTRLALRRLLPGQT